MGTRTISCFLVRDEDVALSLWDEDDIEFVTGRVPGVLEHLPGSIRFLSELSIPVEWEGQQACAVAVVNDSEERPGAVLLGTFSVGQLPSLAQVRRTRQALDSLAPELRTVLEEGLTALASSAGDWRRNGPVNPTLHLPEWVQGTLSEERPLSSQAVGGVMLRTYAEGLVFLLDGGVLGWLRRATRPGGLEEHDPLMGKLQWASERDGQWYWADPVFGEQPLVRANGDAWMESAKALHGELKSPMDSVVVLFESRVDALQASREQLRSVRSVAYYVAQDGTVKTPST